MFDTLKQFLKLTNSPIVESSLVYTLDSFIIVNSSGDNLEQISIAFKQYSNAKNFLNNSFIKKSYPNAFIITRVIERSEINGD